MSPQDRPTEPPNQHRPADPGFQLVRRYRRRLTEGGKNQYDAARRGKRRRAERLRSRLVEDSPIDAGVGRLVYPLPDRAYTGGRYDEYILKLPIPDYHDRYGYDRDGRSQNRAERALWAQYRTRWLVPVVAAEQRGQWLIMPRGQPVETDPAWLGDWTCEFVDAHGLDSAHGHDLEPENIVLLDGQPRLCDYGVLSA